MSKPIHLNDAVLWYMDDLTSRIVAKTGIPSDRFHLGKILFHSMKETDPEIIMQIDGGTGQSENYGSVLKRSVKCANALRNLGINKGDVMILMAPNHLDLAIPIYAALYLGVIIAPMIRTLGIGELQHKYSIYRPKIIFCENERVPYIQEALKNIGSDAKIITFDTGDRVCSFSELLDKFGNDTSVEDFRPTDLDPEDTIALFLPTSGTTGRSKAVVFTHKNFAITLPNKWARYTQFPTPTRLVLVVTPLEWLSTKIHFLNSVMLKYPRVQTSLPITREHAYYLINTYRPSFMTINPKMMATLFEPRDGEQCDFTCFDYIWLGGSSVPQTLIEEVKTITPETEITNAFGISESTGLIFQDSNPPKGSCGKRIALFQYKISPVQLENVIRMHYGVLDVAATSVPDRECGELPVACVVPKPNHTITSQEIKDLVKESLSDTKQLWGGVIFMSELPTAPSTKLDRQKLKQIVLTMERE